MNKQSLIALLVFLVLVTVVCAVGLSLYRSKGLPIAASGQAFALEAAIEAYHAELGSYPPGTTNAEIVRALQQENPNAFDYILATSLTYEVYIALQEQPDGSRVAVDVWGNPLQITFPPATETPTVVSSGPDGLPDTSDDITSAAARTLEPAKTDEEEPAS